MSIFPGRDGRLSMRRHARTGAIGLLLAGASTVAFAGVASAHVEVKPESVPGGDFAQVAFAVPNEESHASTVKLVVVLPTDTPLASVQTTPLPGWSVSTKERTLSEPIDFFGSKVSRVVSQVTWTATAGGIGPGQFQDFPLSLGVLPESGELVFKAVQTYSNGDVVTWNETAIGDAEPEHPAPTLELTAPDDGSHADASGDSHSADLETGASHSGDGSGSAVPLVVSIAALVASIGALTLAWRRGGA
jgi:periplasmic copper chaperone A